MQVIDYQTQKRNSAVSQALLIATKQLEIDNHLFSIESSKLTIKRAESREDLQKVFKLRYEVYLEKGYAFNRANQMEVTNYDASQDALILMVENEKNEIVGSLSLYYDKVNFLPADSIFKDELTAIRKEGVRIVEVSQFVVRQDYQHQKDILLSLINTIYIHAFRIMKVDEFIIEVNPRHVDYYRKLLGFIPFGIVKECPRVNNAPAVLLRCTSEKYLKVVDKGEFEKRTLYNRFMSKKNEEAVIAKLQVKQPMLIKDQKYFGLI